MLAAPSICCSTRYKRSMDWSAYTPLLSFALATFFVKDVAMYGVWFAPTLLIDMMFVRAQAAIPRLVTGKRLNSLE